MPAIHPIIRDWSDLDLSFRQRIEPVLKSDSKTAADRWQSEFVTNPSNAAGFVLAYAAMESAGIWSAVSGLINTWAVGMFFVPLAEICETMDGNTKFVNLDGGKFRHRLAHHAYWEKSWLQTNVRQTAIHIGINRDLENGKRKAEVHLDVFNGFHNGFNGLLSVKHVLFEVLLKRRHSTRYFGIMLEREGIIIPAFTS